MSGCPEHKIIFFSIRRLCSHNDKVGMPKKKVPVKLPKVSHSFTAVSASVSTEVPQSSVSSRPRIIALEQVSAFASHEHYHFVVQTLRWAGYHLFHAQVIEASDILPIARARWLAYAIRVNDVGASTVPFQSWIPRPAVVPNTWNVCLPEEFLQDPRLFPQPAVLALSARHDLLPPAKRRLIHKDMVLASRCYDGSGKLPTLVASYGSQHCFSEAWLSEKGLLNHFFHQPGKNPRYWHPAELWMMHAAHGKQFFMHQWDKAYRHVGNQICTPHALLVISNVLNCLHKVPQKIDPARMIANFVDNRNTAQDIKLIRTQSGDLACPTEYALTNDQIHNLNTFHSGLCDGTIPDQMQWTIDGFAELQKIAPTEPDDIAPTAPFAVFHTVQVCTQGRTFQAFVQDGLPIESVMQVWDHAFFPLDCFEAHEGVETVLIPKDDWKPTTDPLPKVWIIFHDRCLYIALPTEVTLSWFLGLGHGRLTDMLGQPLQLEQPEGCLATAGFSLSLQVPGHYSVARLLQAESKCHTNLVCDQRNFRIALHLTGEAHHLKILENFWTNAISTQDLDAIGISQKLCRTHGITIVSWEVQNSACPMPVHLLTYLLFSQGFSQIFAKLNDPNGLPVRIKLFGRFASEFRLPKNLSIASVKQLVHAVSKVHVGKLQFRIIHKGRQPSPEQDLISLHQHGSKAITLHMVLELHGGGENGTKAGHRTQIKNAIASCLLEEGYELAWTTKSVEQLMAKMGTKELALFLQQPHASKLSTALSFLKGCEIDLPKVNPAKASQTAANAKKKRTSPMPDPSNYSVFDGTLKNENDTPSVHIAKFGGHLQGFHMCTPQSAVPWLRQGDILSKDELALLIFGELPISTRLEHEHVTVPCTDERGRQVLVACVLVQCGEKKIKIAKGDGHSIATDGTILVAVTWRKQDWPTTWNEICDNPYKAIRVFPGAADILVSVWGKSYRQGKSPATSATANSVQVHCLFKEDQFPAFLKLSGFNHLWLSPKTKEGKPHPSWRIIWLDSSADMQVATALTAKLDQSAGLVCQPQRYAIRVPKSAYEDAWKVLFPSTPAPEDIDTSRVFKIECLPFGVTSAMLIAWAQHVSWKLRPLRAVGPRAWLIGTGQDPPAPQLHFNSMPVLARELKGRFQATSSPIVAGPKPSRSSGNNFNQHEPSPLQGDPWANYQGPKPAMPASVPQANPIGPTEQKFAQQEDRLNKLEEAMKQINTGQQKQGILIEKIQKDQIGRDQEIRQHIDDKFSAIKVDFDRTLAGALQHQASQFSASMEEIKSLLRERPKRKTQSGDEVDADMNDS
eukprot:s1479_g7.t1